MTNDSERPSRPSLRIAAMTLALMGTLASFVHAQVLVTDVGTIAAVQEGAQSQLAQALARYTKQGLQYTNDLARYATLVQQLENMMTSIENLGTGISIAPKTLQPLTDVETDWLVQQHCSVSSSGIIGNILSGVMSMLQSAESQSIAARQQTICVATVLVTVDKYNITANALRELTLQASTVQNFQNVVNSITTLGKAESANAQAQAFLVNLNTSNATWERQIQADDAMIASLEEQQSILANIALKGRSAVGEIVQGAAFAAAFH